MNSSPRIRLLAGLETLLIFGAVSVCFRWIASLDISKLLGISFTGMNIVPYLALWVFTPVFLLLSRRGLAQFGLSIRPAPYHLQIAAAGFIPFFVLGVALSWVSWKTWAGAALIAVIEGALLIATAWFLRKYPGRDVPVLLAASVLFTPFVAFNASKAFLSLFYTYLLVTPAEEMFFRGYIQSRLNLAFGRPFCNFGIRWGWGLVGSAALFGLWHVAAIPQPVWPHALWTVVLGLMLGVVREKSGSMFAPTLLHGVVNYGPQAFLFNLFF